MKHIFRFTGLIALSATLVMATLVACDDDPETTAAVPDGGPKADGPTGETSTTESGSLKGNITYTGVQRGAFYVAIFKSISPGPTGLSGASAVFTPTIPGSSPYTVTNVPPGDYFVSAYLAPAVQGQPPNPGPTTPLAPFTPVTITAGGTATQDLTIVDPPADEAGVDAGTDADAGGG